MGCDLIEAALNNVGPQDTCEQSKGRDVSRDTERHANNHGFEMVRAAFHGDSGSDYDRENLRKRLAKLASGVAHVDLEVACRAAAFLLKPA